MSALPFILVLQLPPLAFGPTRPEAYQPPRELTCPVTELARPRPTRPLPLPPTLPILDAAVFRPGPPAHLVGPLSDGFIFLGLTLLSHATGGSVTPDAWPGDRHWFAQRK